jgi:hypothetical protein
MKNVLMPCSAALAAAFLSGCVVHPLPDDVTDNTVMIVTKIRCEARDAVMAALMDYLKRGTFHEVSFAKALTKTPTDIFRIDEFGLGSDTLRYLSNYQRGAIGYEFTLNISEKVTAGFGTNLLDVFGNGSRAFDLGAGVDRTNTNSRNFLISDGFEDLVKLYGQPNRSGKDYCKDVTGGNKMYPISGKIGLKEFVSTFVELHDTAGIDAQSDDKVSTFTDAIEFETVYTGRANPKIELKAKTHGFGVKDASLSNSFTRTDNHKVVVAIRLPPKVEVKPNSTKSAAVRPTSANASTNEPVSAQDGVILDLNRRRAIDLYQSLDVIRRVVE